MVRRGRVSADGEAEVVRKMRSRRRRWCRALAHAEGGGTDEGEGGLGGSRKRTRDKVPGLLGHVVVGGEE
ncbi:hypothetical protein O9K51_04643 [Purpureocillium lavendulum]|uniref:Uncharacterized protein n=1 Tax=Purpureocillium lavendulum TaxID=1247861 RepID=A0AB34FX45_9HYPO|nr:hypothetical protein O9K51_04643 [Purpureocillium lavendulum]